MVQALSGGPTEIAREYRTGKQDQGGASPTARSRESRHGAPQRQHTRSQDMTGKPQQEHPVVTGVPMPRKKGGVHGQRGSASVDMPVAHMDEHTCTDGGEIEGTETVKRIRSEEHGANEVMHDPSAPM